MLLVLISVPLISEAGELPALGISSDSSPGAENTSRYLITHVTLPVQTRWTETGKSLSPTITVTNEGSDDTGEETMTVSAYLGSYPLISKRNTITPLNGGESRDITLEFLIPDGIPSRDYQFTVSLDNRTEPGETDRSIQQIKAPDLLTVTSKPPKVRMSGCGCS